MPDLLDPRLLTAAATLVSSVAALITAAAALASALRAPALSRSDARKRDRP